jgi:hypothetical protein
MAAPGGGVSFSPRRPQYHKSNMREGRAIARIRPPIGRAATGDADKYV